MTRRDDGTEDCMQSPHEADIDKLFDFYLSHGCPCRFPRFRASVARDLKEVGADYWEAADKRLLLQTFDRRVDLNVDKREALATVGTCKRCGAHVHRYAIPVFQDSFVERALITPASLPDLGAPVEGPLPICGPLFLAGPVSARPDERRRIEHVYPRLSVSDWLDYMRALGT